MPRRKKNKNKKKPWRVVSHQYLDNKESKKYPQKWIMFSRFFLNANYGVVVYESQSTVSKYIYVSDGSRVYKVRFSNHSANPHMENKQDCNFYVGYGNNGVTTTQQAIHATLDFFTKSA